MTKELQKEIYIYMVQNYRKSMECSDTLAELAIHKFYNAESYTDEIPLVDQRIIEDMAVSIFVRHIN